MDSRVGGWIVLGAGLAALAVGIAVGVSRHDDDVEARARQIDRYDALLADVADRPPRFEVAYIDFPLAAFKRLQADRRRYTIVRTEVARRIETGRPPLHPDFGSLRHPPVYDRFAAAYRRAGTHRQWVSVAALLVTQTAPGDVSELRLRVRRLVPHDYAEIVDATDLFGDWFRTGRSDITATKDLIRWKPAARGVGMLIPLGVIHGARIPVETDPALLASTNGGWAGISYAALGARRLSVVEPGGRVTRLPIDDVLRSPVRLNLGAG